ncbi:unnamed protein product [Hydatigera taeniaeformis]|uniref:Uncharacterized protein n=1 Tax=Hydatigena taeniaeformis TaxID=6205 RepID=A0A0R3X038_HYDTA|nr:unnamed protein product [Hydatigera taeniaeformis]
MSVQDSTSVLLDLFYYVGLGYKAGTFGHFNLNSSFVDENFLRALYSFIQQLNYGHPQFEMEESVNLKSLDYIFFINKFLISRLSPIYICRVKEFDAGLNVVLLAWCLTDSNIAYMPERALPSFLFDPPEEDVALPQNLCKPVRNLKMSLLNISGVISAISIKEAEVYSLFKTLMMQNRRFFDEKFSQLTVPMQRNITVSELIYIFDNHKYSRTAAVKKAKQLLDLLSKWNRNSAAFYRLLRLSSEFSCETNSTSTLSNDSLIDSYGDLEDFRSILVQCAPNLDSVTTAAFNRSHSTLHEEFKRRLDFVADRMNPELLQLASYLAQHDVAFNNLPQYPTEDSGDQDTDSINVHAEAEPKIKPKNRRGMANPLPRTYSPPVRNINFAYSRHKPLHAPTERQLNAAKASHLRQLINKSKAALLNLDSEISAKRFDFNLQMLPTGSGVSVRYHLPRRRTVRPSGVLKPCVRILGEKRAWKEKRSALKRWTTDRSIMSGTHDTNLLSSYLKRLALGGNFEGQVDGLQRSYRSPSFKSGRVSGENFFSDSIENFIRNHSKQKVLSQNPTPMATEVELNYHNSPKSCHFENLPRKQSSPMVKIPLPGKRLKTSTYQTLRLPVEQYRQLLTQSKTVEILHEERWKGIAFPSNTTSLSSLCDWLVVEIVDSCVEAIANLVDCLSNDIIDELFRHELVTTSSSPWESFSGLAGSPQPRSIPSLQSLITSVPSKVPVKLDQQKITSGEYVLNQDSEERKNSTLKYGDHFTIESTGVAYAQTSEENRIVTQEACTSLQLPAHQPQKALSPIEEVSTVSFPPNKANLNQSGACDSANKQCFNGSFSAYTVWSTLESTCINSRFRKSSNVATSSPDLHVSDEEVIEKNVTTHYSTGDSPRKKKESLSILDAQGQTSRSAKKITITSPDARKSPDISTSSSIKTSSISRKLFKLSGGLSKKSSSVRIDVDHADSLADAEVLAPIMTNEEVLSNKRRKSPNPALESTSSLKEFSIELQSKCDRVPTSNSQEGWVFPQKLSESQRPQDDCSVTLPITSEGLSSPKSVKLYKMPRSLDLLSPLTDTSVPDICTPDVEISTKCETLQVKTLSVGNITTSEVENCANYEDDFESSEDLNQDEKPVG